MARPHIQVILAADQVPECLRAALQRADATAGFWPLSEALRGDAAAGADALVVVLPEESSGLSGPLRVLLDRLAEHPRGTLVLAPSGRPLPRLDHPPSLPVSFSSGLDEESLAVQLTTMIEMRHSLDSLHQRVLANRRQGQSAARQYMGQLRLASQVQRGFLPKALPRFGPVSFNCLFRPVDYVSGDIYDLHQLDEQHVGIALADASGHGIPAALLTVYIKRALRAKEIEKGSYRLLSPGEVLRDLNQDILDAHLTECPFVAVVYAVLDISTLELSLARAGAPYPIRRTAGGELEFLDPPGSVVGVLSNACFGVSRLRLQPGDSLLIYSDGLERIVTPRCATGDVLPALQRVAGRAVEWTSAAAATVPAAAVADGTAEVESSSPAIATLPGDGRPLGRGISEPTVGRRLSLSHQSDPGRPVPPPATRLRAPHTTACEPGSGHDLIMSSAWCHTLRTEGVQAALEQISGRQRTLRRMGYPLDDLTVLAVQVDP
jgi:hypothetical protein